MKLSELSKAAATHKPNHSILLYGNPKTGKTRLVGTVAKIPEIKRIFWFDLENGAETLLHMNLSPDELDKINLIAISDTREIPRGIETVLKAFSSKTPIKICDLHGKVGCIECEKTKASSVEFCMNSLTKSDLVVIDSGSQLGDSALALAMAGRDITAKPGYDEYGMASKYLSDILSIIQAAFYTNFVVITHVIPIEEEMNGVKRDRYFPLMGTRAMCQKVAKYFGTVVFVEIKMGKHAAGSSSLYRGDATTGSRTNAKIEASKELDMRSILVEGGILA
ncbi:MAG: hypothetical protein ACD_86C00003G0021 [uncultured bacterium]|nr:MAG: hypothetical protein ACD_86C00003G0021 [uncultured bacterium]